MNHTHAAIHINTPVTRVEGNLVNYNNTQASFDKIIITTDPNTALQLRQNPLPIEQRLLGGIDTGTMTSTLHQDPKTCPHGAMTLNLYDPQDQQSSPHVVTTWGQRTCFNFPLKTEHYVSIHETGKSPVKDEQILEQARFTVALPTFKTLKTLENIDQLNQRTDMRKQSIYYCGSYFSAFFYHEDAITAAIKLAKQLKEN